MNVQQVKLIRERATANLDRARRELTHVYTPISKNVVGENGEWQLSKGNCATERNCGFHINELFATQTPQICIFDNEKQYFCTLCTCIFHLLTF